MYEVGKVYIWQNQVGDYAFLNGTETTVTSQRCLFYIPAMQRNMYGWKTDSSPPPSQPPDGYMIAFAGDLRPKDPPSGEKSILELFTLMPELETI